MSSASSPRQAAAAAVTPAPLQPDEVKVNRRTPSFHAMRPMSATQQRRPAAGSIELTDRPQHRGVGQQPHNEYNENARLHAPSEMLSEDEEEQMKLEAQIGMLLTAASKNNVKRMRGLLNAGVPPSSCDYDRRTGLHLACSEGHMEAVQLLVEEGADVNAKDRFGSTPLDDAMRDGSNHELVAYLRSKQAKHGGLDRLQAKLFQHVSKNEVASVRALLTKDIDGHLVVGGACIDPNCVDYDKRTPLHLAVAEGHAELVALLLANGADPHAEDRWGLTPLAEADRKAARVGVDPIKELFRLGGHIPHEEESPFSFFSVFFGFWELAMMILIGLFCTYGHSASGGQHEDDARRAAGLAAVTLDEFKDAASETASEFSRVYPLYQDVHVMIFVGFGFLMVFLRKHGYTSVGMTFLIGAFVVQWYQLVNGFWEDAFTGNWVKIPISVHTLVRGDFAAGAVLITFGVLLGKVNPQQILFISIIETVFFTLNEHIGLKIGVADMGGTMTIHMFGAFFGYGCTWMMTPKAAHGHENNCGNYHSDIMAMIGTVFLWMFWPSFNGALSVGAAQERCIINTVFAMCGSCVVAFLASHLFRRERRFNMVDIQNATLAGGVAMGASAEMLVTPGAAIGIGGFAGLVSVLGYVYVQPFLESRLGLHDTCGVNNLHGMPSLIGGFASVIAAGLASLDGYLGDEGYGESQMAWTFPKRALDPTTGKEGRSAQTQAVIQFAYMMTSLFIALLSGSIAGHFATLKAFTPTKVEDMYVDQEYWEVPQFETPYYFDHRGEVQRGTDATTVAAPGHLAEAGLTDDLDGTGAEGQVGENTPRHGNGGIITANLDAPDNARLLGLITALETRLNVLTRRVGGQVVGQTPLSGVAAIPQQHHTKSAAAAAVFVSGGGGPVTASPPDYPASKLASNNNNNGGNYSPNGGNNIAVVPGVAPMELTSVATHNGGHDDPPLTMSPLHAHSTPLFQ